MPVCEGSLGLPTTCTHVDQSKTRRKKNQGMILNKSVGVHLHMRVNMPPFHDSDWITVQKSWVSMFRKLYKQYLHTPTMDFSHAHPAVSWICTHINVHLQTECNEACDLHLLYRIFQGCLKLMKVRTYSLYPYLKLKHPL